MPTKPFRELLEKMPAHRRRNVARRVQETLAAMPLDELRKARRMTQARLVETLGVKQGEVSKIEHRTEAYVFDRKLEELVISRMDRNSAQAVRFRDNPEIRDVITRLIRDQVYDRIQDQSKARAATV
jgi:transcriptional regulator with XRE-family HTH domain